MRIVFRSVPSIIMILFELFVGIMLFRDPTGFTNRVVVLFGIFMLVLGVMDLIKAYRFKTVYGPDKAYLAGAIADLVLGMICILGSKILLGVFPMLVVLYGIFLIITGFYKGRNYFSLRRAGFRPHLLALISAAAAIVLGVILVLHPGSTAETLWSFAGVVLIVEALLDLIAAVLMRTADI